MIAHFVDDLLECVFYTLKKADVPQGVTSMSDRKATQEQVEQAISRIRKFWEMGKEVQAMIAGESRGESGENEYSYGNKLQMQKDLATKYETNYDRIPKAVRISEEYTPEQVDKICSEIRKNHSRFGDSLWARLLGIKDRKKRDKILFLAIRKCWSFRELNTVVVKETGNPRSRTGRKPRIPEQESETLTELRKRCGSWTRFVKASLPTLPVKIKSKCKSIVKLINELDSEIAKVPKTK